MLDLKIDFHFCGSPSISYKYAYLCMYVCVCVCIYIYVYTYNKSEKIPYTCTIIINVSNNVRKKSKQRKKWQFFQSYNNFKCSCKEFRQTRVL